MKTFHTFMQFLAEKGIQSSTLSATEDGFVSAGNINPNSEQSKGTGTGFEVDPKLFKQLMKGADTTLTPWAAINKNRASFVHKAIKQKAKDMNTDIEMDTAPYDDPMLKNRAVIKAFGEWQQDRLDKEAAAKSDIVANIWDPDGTYRSGDDDLPDEPTSFTRKVKRKKKNLAKGLVSDPDQRNAAGAKPPTSFTQNVKRKKKNLAKG